MESQQRKTQMPGNFTKSQFERWDAAIAKTSPGAASKDEVALATIVTGCVLQGMSDGVLMRFSDENGDILTFRLNAAIALRLADAIPAAAIMQGWLGRDGIVNALPDH